ncbi:hypothetical protein [Nonomuraea rhodomycinica]|uniref:Uncharacterized protein n=1 Tax=Nonomuraea rhodomycinica TaxID=1712872 RepID=A0A7Y6IRT1_9ACTN|nr:hypothetical protein [Nonomuraea rhodomycinica]NUW42940.1 hypothetical protein [Nonomuraea rhodomycinica]
MLVAIRPRMVSGARSGFAVGATTAWRCIRAAITLPADRSPGRDQASRAARQAGYAFVVLDGTLIPIDRVA